MNSNTSTTTTISADSALLEAYVEWRHLAELESEAIAARDWARLTDCQTQLAALQPRITRLTRLAREEWEQMGIDCSEKESNFREIIAGLIKLESRNSSLLAAAKEAAHKQLSQLEIARQNLKRVHRSYSQLTSPVWFSFS